MPAVLDGAAGPSIPDEAMDPQWEAGERFFQEKRYAEATRTWERLLTHPSRPLPEAQVQARRRRLAYGYLCQAMALEPFRGDRKDALQALRHLTRARELDPQAAEYPYWAGVIHRHYGVWDKAVSYFREALAADPGHAWSRLELGWALLRLQADGAQQVSALLKERPRSLGGEVPEWHWQRLEAAALLKARRYWDAFRVYPKTPPDAVSLEQWWKELSHLAKAAVHQEPVRVLEVMESAWEQLQLLATASEEEHGGLSRDQILAFMGELAAEGGDDEKAWRYWGRIPESSPARAHIREEMARSLDRRARAAFQQGDVDVAIALWQQASAGQQGVAASRERLVQALLSRGAAHWDDGDVGKAVEAWRQASEHNPRQPAAWYNLALAGEALGNWPEANRCWLQFLTLLKEEGPHAAHPVAVGPESILVRAAVNAVRGGQGEEALKLLARCQDRVMRDPKLLTLAALLHLQSGNAQRSLELLQKALKLDAKFEPAVKGMVHLHHAQAVEAADLAALLKPMLQQFPRDSWAYQYARNRVLNWGMKAYNSGALDEAMKHFASLLLSDAADVEAWLWCGAVHMKKRNVAGYEDCYSEAIRLAPDQPQTYIFIGVRFLADDDRERAEEYFERALKVNPSPVVRTMIGEAYADMGLPEVAERYFQQALEEDSKEKPALVLRAICSLIQAGAEELVEPFLIHATHLAPEIIEARVLLAALAIRHRDWTLAQKNLGEAQRLAVARGEGRLLDHITFFQHAIILLRTVGEIDDAAFNQNIQSVLSQWIKQEADAISRSSGEEVEPVQELIASLIPALEPLSPVSGPAREEEKAEAAQEPAQAKVEASLFFAVELPTAPSFAA